MKVMKFIVNAAKPSLGRRGTLTDLPRIPGLSIETPAIMMYTKSASIPHLTHEVLQMLTTDKFLMEAPLLTTLHMVPGVKAHGKGLAQFCGLGEYPNLMLLQDPIADIPFSPMEFLKVPLWTRKGKIQIDANGYMDAIEHLKPDIYAAFCDGFTDDTSSKKRLAKSAIRNAAMLATCIERHQKSEYLSHNSSLLGVIEGGHSLEDRKKSAESLITVSDKLGGFVLDGINHNGTSIKEYQKDKLELFLQNITTLLPDDKLRVAPGCWNAVTLLYLVSSGWDVFDTCMPYQATEKFHALSFHFRVDIKMDTNKDYEMNLQDKIHNLHHYIEFFKEIRRCVASEKMVLLHNLVEEQYNRRVEPLLCENSKDTDIKKLRRMSTDFVPDPVVPEVHPPKRSSEI